VLGTVKPGDPATTERVEAVASRLLATAASRYPGRVAAEPVPAGAPGWVGVDALATAPEAFERLVAATAARYGTDDRALAVGQVVREAVSVVTGAAVTGWARHGGLLDWRAGNVVLRPGDRGLVVGLRRLRLADAGAVAEAGTAGPAGAEDPLAALDASVLGRPVPAGALPPGPPGRAATVATVVAAGRRAARTGARHYWGSAALAAVVALAGHPAERDRLLARRPDLARTVEVTGGEGGGARRLTCCLLVKLPDAPQCATCPLTPAAGRRLRPRGPGSGGRAAAPAPATA
jgi:hypothetical protein